MRTRLWSLVCIGLFAVVAACGGNNNNNGTDGGGGGGGDGGLTGDGGGCVGIGCPGGIDAPPFGGTCDPAGPQCSNCVDDDGDGDIDGFDIECSGSLDNDEGSFGTDIPGDNIDAVMQDCFFDGNSGAGNDGCNIHVCCILGAPDVASCPIGANRYDPADCPPPLGTVPLSQMCIDNCGGLTPPGCDCFGCCTLCDASGNCYDVNINPNVSPGCDETNLSDPNVCKICTKNTNCGNDECGGTSCILCPGQDPSTLDPSCNDTPTCPTGTTACGAAGECAANTYCSNGCCIGVIL